MSSLTTHRFATISFVCATLLAGVLQQSLHASPPYRASVSPAPGMVLMPHDPALHHRMSNRTERPLQSCTESLRLQIKSGWLLMTTVYDSGRYLINNPCGGISDVCDSATGMTSIQLQVEDIKYTPYSDMSDGECECVLDVFKTIGHIDTWQPANQYCTAYVNYFGSSGGTICQNGDCDPCPDMVSRVDNKAYNTYILRVIDVGGGQYSGGVRVYARLHRAKLPLQIALCEDCESSQISTYAKAGMSVPPDISATVPGCEGKAFVVASWGGNNPGIQGSGFASYHTESNALITDWVEMGTVGINTDFSLGFVFSMEGTGEYLWQSGALWTLELRFYPIN